MTGTQPSRRRHVRRKRLHCALCGSTEHVELHHIGGRFHLAWFIVPLCRSHHLRITAMLRAAGVDMRYTSDVQERIRRVRRALLVFQWLIEEWESSAGKDNVHKSRRISTGSHRRAKENINPALARRKRSKMAGRDSCP